MLTQIEADLLIEMPKRLVGHEEIVFPQRGEKASLEAISVDGREKFLMDMNRGRLRLTKCSYQERYRHTEILVRVDVGVNGAAPHRNPDGQLISGPHIHLYREGYGSKWAEPLGEQFGDPSDLTRTLRDFLVFCRVANIPDIQASLQ